MSENINIEEVQAALQETVEQLQNKKYPDWDNIIIQLNQGDGGVAHIRMMRQDLEAMVVAHYAERKDVVEMMLQALEEQLTEK